MDEISEAEEAWNLSQIRQRPSRLTARPIGSVVRKLMSQSGYGQIQAHNQLSECWAQAVGIKLAALTRPVKISRGVLHVIVANSATVQELYFERKRVLSLMQKALPDSKIKDIKTRVGNLD